MERKEGEKKFKYHDPHFPWCTTSPMDLQRGQALRASNSLGSVLSSISSAGPMGKSLCWSNVSKGTPVTYSSSSMSSAIEKMLDEGSLSRLAFCQGFGVVLRVGNCVRCRGVTANWFGWLNEASEKAFCNELVKAPWIKLPRSNDSFERYALNLWSSWLIKATR